MFKSLIFNLKNPHKVPLKILSKIFFWYKRSVYKTEVFISDQNKKFEKINFNRDNAKKKLDSLKQKYDFLTREMSSEHELLFASISIYSKIKINNILEIGTFDGVNAFLLSQLFKDSKIDTIDLKSNEEDFKNFYNRKNNIKDFLNKRDSLLSGNSNIKYKDLNSVKLTFSKKKYDLIWIDGAHGYPVCCIDIINSVKLINSNGYIIIDDISLESENNDRMYDSIAGYETLKELEKNKMIELHLFYKRLDANSNCVEKRITYVALIKLSDQKSNEYE